ncbi:hypothetical protein Y1Q_0015087 [Alligator mississippiensis]|uniref:Uncharacterized protein n=1 Tax=Alligator mississippiensis TaxID=8496 RepID=A0A151P8K8_ALLMI|nr:hypothetical protein Y1Q_0015087 [Alligator mississippiensis]
MVLPFVTNSGCPGRLGIPTPMFLFGIARWIYEKISNLTDTDQKTFHEIGDERKLWSTWNLLNREDLQEILQELRP